MRSKNQKKKNDFGVAKIPQKIMGFLEHIPLHMAVSSWQGLEHVVSAVI